MNALESTNISEDDLLKETNEIKEELKSASNNPKKEELTQLEKLALKSKETPDSWAETSILIFLTFIINTFYFLSRRKKNKLIK